MFEGRKAFTTYNFSETIFSTANPQFSCKLKYRTDSTIEQTPLLYSTKIPFLSAFCSTFHFSWVLDPQYHSHFFHHHCLSKFHPALLRSSLAQTGILQLLSKFLNLFLLETDKKEINQRTASKINEQMKSYQCVCFVQFFIFFSRTSTLFS